MAAGGQAALFVPALSRLMRTKSSQSTRAKDTPHYSTYRPDIDGLRALAVLSVVLFHAGFPAFAEGFLGVDVFFVISGFLITRLIKQQVEADAFSFREFYMRRARRLLPAFLVTTAASAVAGYFVLPPKLLLEFGSSAVAASLALSNVYFFQRADYFDTDAILKPLLHTWSLGVEEQFYLVWPALLVGCLSFVHRRTPLVVLGLGAASFAAAAHFSSTHSSAVFYLMPFRVFELAMGAGLVWSAPYQLRPAGLREFGLVAGLALIVLSMLGKLKVSEVPGLVPSLGTMLVIQCGTARHAGQILRNKLAVGIGIISYSIYLVHWPLVVYLKYDKFEDFSTLERWFLVGAALFCGGLLYTLVEKPFRRGQVGAALCSDRSFVIGYLTALACVMGVTAHMRWQGGWLWRYPEAIRAQIQAERLKSYESYTFAAYRKTRHAFLFDGRRRVFILGDSQSADLVNMLAETGRLGVYDLATAVVDMQCQALITLDRAQFEALSKEDQAACGEQFRAVVEGDLVATAQSVVLAFNWTDRGVPFIDRAVADYRRRGVEKVFVVNGKQQGYSGADVVLHFGPLSGGADAFSASKKNPITWSANARLAAMQGFTVIDVMSKVCPGPDVCHVVTPDQNIIFFDRAHFTPAGARYIGRLLLESGAFTF